MSADDIEQLSDAWNDTARDYDIDTTLGKLIAAQASRSPQARAIAFGDRDLSFFELDRRARILARFLRSRGIGPGGVVAIGMDRSVELIVGLVGILYAGAAYLPLDPDYPENRLSFMVGDSGVDVVLTQDHRVARFTKPGIETIALDTWAAEWNADPGPLDPPGDGESLAYVIYTSGSTGKPKGAMIAHRSIVNRLFWMRDAFEIGPGDRILQKTPSSFDVSVWEFFLPLITGAELIVAQPGGHRDPRYLVETIQNEGITTLHFVPSMLQVFLEERDLDRCHSLRRVICSGEALPFALQQRFFDRLDAELHNLYGPTEAAVDVTWWRCDRNSPLRIVPIGRPIANTQLHVVGEDLRPQAPGEVGELCIGGVQVGLGYLNRPELTAERFVRDPFRDDPSARLYRTGDLVRFLPDGALEYLGRLDHQVKLRGFRVELGEVEAAIGECPGVRENVVVPRQSATGETQLVGYVVPEAVSNREISHEAVGRWREIFDQTYAHETVGTGADLNVAGWNSSYTGEPIPEEEMLEWVEQTVSRIREFGARRILEIGCGTGMLLLRLAPGCDRYVGTDISPVAVGALAAKVSERAPHAELLECPADDFSRFQAGDFDLVVINSVIQLFPNAGYLEKVLTGAGRCVREGGALFLGDIRSLSHLEAFHTSLEFDRASGDLPVGRLRQRVHDRRLREEELLVAPEFFEALAERHPRFTAARLDLKRGRFHNELTRFRYDAALQVGGSPEPTEPVENWDWDRDRLSLERVAQRLNGTRSQRLQINGIPNDRLARERWMMQALDECASEGRVETVRRRIEETRDAGVDPEEFRSAIESNHPYHVFLSWTPEQFARMDARLVHTDLPAEGAWLPLRARWADRHLRTWTNDPQRGLAVRTLGPELRRLLRENLPDHMVPAHIVFLDHLPLTANGKVDRGALPEPDLTIREGGEPFVAPRNEVERILGEIWAEVLGCGGVGVHDDFLDLGGDSIQSLLMVARARERGLKLTAAQVFEHRTIADLAGAAGCAVEAVADQAPTTGSQRLTPMQRWVIEHAKHAPNHTNQVTLLRSSRRLDPGTLSRALSALVDHHDVLRLRFRGSGVDSQAWYAPPGGVHAIEHVDLSGDTEDQRRVAIERAGDSLHASLDRERGPMVRLALLESHSDLPQFLLLSLHHLVTDGVSLRILLEDLQSAYDMAARGREIRLASKTSSFQFAAERLHERARAPEAIREARFWTERPRDELLPVDVPTGTNREADARFVQVALDAESTQVLLQALPRLYRARMDDALLSALGRVLADWTRSDSFWIETEGHGRDLGFEDVDLSRTVGSFSALYPLHLTIEGRADAATALKAVKEQRRAVPRGGLSYGLLRYGEQETPLASALRARADAAVLFNYFGQMDSSDESNFLEIVHWPAGMARDPAEQRTHAIDIQSWVQHGLLSVRWTYSGAQCRDDTIRHLAEAHREKLQQLVEHCQQTDAGGYTPSDFSLVSLDQATIDELTAAEDVEDICPLGPLQEGLLFYILYAPESQIYFDQLAATLHHAVDLPAFEAAWQRAVDRHSTLRTRFVWDGVPQPLQVVMRRARLPIEVEDLRAEDHERQNARLQELSHDRGLGYTLDRAPLSSLRLIRLDDDRYRMLWNFHHLILDGWSMVALMDEVLADYKSPAPIEEASKPPPFGAYLRWRSQRDLEASSRYWSRILAGFSQRTPLPGDREPTGLPIAHADWAIHTAALTEVETHQLARTARDHRLTINTIVLGAWALALGFSAERDDVVFGAVVPGRPAELAGSDAMIGLLMNTIPVRARLQDSVRVSEWLAELQNEQAGAREHCHLSVASIQSHAEVPRGQPLFDCVVGIQGDFRNQLSLQEWAEKRGLSSAVLIDWNNLPLSLGVEHGSSLATHFKYHRSRFTSRVIVDTAADYLWLLRRWMQFPDARIEELRADWSEQRRQRHAEASAEAREESRGRLRSVKRRSQPPR